MANDKQLWETHGEGNPYFAVSTHDKFKTENLDESNLVDFFATGERYVDDVWVEIEKHFVENFNPESALDFGSGVGRLTIPLASLCDRVTGVDVSSTMVAEATKNALAKGVENVDFVQDNDGFQDSDETFDFVHSYIVIQHIDPKIGYDIFESLVKKVKENGIGVLQVTYHNPSPIKSKIAVEIYKKVPLIYRLRNNIKNQKEEMLLPMHSYDLNKLFRILHNNNCHQTFIRNTYHGLYGLLIMFRKNENIFI